MDKLTTENRNWFKRNLIPIIMTLPIGFLLGWFGHAIKVAFFG